MNRSRTTRLLHLLLALGVVFQLLASEFMAHPEEEEEEDHAAWIAPLASLIPSAQAHEDEDEEDEPTGPVAEFLFEAHEVVGLGLGVVVLAFWGWIAVRRDEPGLGEMVPWFSGARLGAVGEDFKRHLAALSRGRLPEYRPHSPFVTAIHGLGLLAVTLMALSGFGWWLGVDLGLAEGLGEAAEEVHEIGANLVWIYLIGHVAMAILHQLRGEGVIGKMLSLRD